MAALDSLPLGRKPNSPNMFGNKPIADYTIFSESWWGLPSTPDRRMATSPARCPSTGLQFGAPYGSNAH